MPKKKIECIERNMKKVNKEFILLFNLKICDWNNLYSYVDYNNIICMKLRLINN